MKKLIFTFLLLFGVAFSLTIKAQTINFDYDDAGNCIEKYKTVVLASKSKGKTDSTMYKAQIDTISNKEVVIYPNPTKGALKIEIKGVTPENPIQYLLTDMNGKTIQTGNSNETYFEFDLSAYPAGIYILRVMIEGKWNKWKIIKQ